LITSFDRQRLARAGSLALAAAYLAVFAAGAPARWRELAQVCAADQCPALGLTPVDAEALHALGWSLRSYATYQVGIEIAAGLLHLLPAAVIFWRRGDSWLGRLAATALIGFGTNLLSEGTSALARVYPALGGLTTTLQTVAVLLFAWLLFAFPNGRLVPAWAWVLGLPLLPLAAVNAIYRPTVATTDPLRQVIVLALVATFVTGVGAQLYRFRYRCTPTERQQTKWVLFGMTGMAANLILWAAVVEFFTPPPGPARLAAYLAGVGLTALLWATLPLSLAVAILRYRLWEIDVLIRRTLVYSVLTASLATIYLGAVIVLQSALRLITGQAQSRLVVVLSTLLIAALFVPVRRRWQAAIDRRFYRRRYDADLVLRALAAGLRDEVDLEPVVERVIATVYDAVQPESVSLWLREAPAQRQPLR
jgi:hypothetical protein